MSAPNTDTDADSTIHTSLAALTSTIPSLTTALQPLLIPPPSSSALPLLDKAKEQVLTAYAIESLLFSALRLQGNIDVKTHPVFAELTRTREYFRKIKEVEEGPTVPRMRVDREAVGRFVRAGVKGAAAAAASDEGRTAVAAQEGEEGRETGKMGEKSKRKRGSRGRGRRGSNMSLDGSSAVSPVGSQETPEKKKKKNKGGDESKIAAM
jgi:exosome complex protein LRP1